MSEIMNAGKTKKERLQFTFKMMEAMKKYAEQVAARLDGNEAYGEPVNYEGRKFDGFLNAVVLEDGILCTACNLSPEDMANVLMSIGEGLKDRSPAGTKGRLVLGLLGAKFMTMAIEGLEGDLEAGAAEGIKNLKKLLETSELTTEVSSEETKH